MKRLEYRNLLYSRWKIVVLSLLIKRHYYLLGKSVGMYQRGTIYYIFKFFRDFIFHLTYPYIMCNGGHAHQSHKHTTYYNILLDINLIIV